MKHYQPNRYLVSSSKMSVHVLHNLIFSNPDLIVYCKADGNYTQIHLSNRCLIDSKTLKQVQSLLPEDTFIRIHKSCLININYIIGFKGQNTIIIMPDIELQIARRMRTQVLLKISRNLLSI